MKDKMAKLIEITGRALSGEWGNDDNTGNGIPVLRTTNFTNEGIVNYNNVVTRIIEKKKIEEKYLRQGDIIIEKSGGSDKQPVGRVVYFDGPENTYLFNNFTGLLRVKDQAKWYPRYVFYSLFSNYHRGGTRAFQNKTTGLHNLKIDDFVSRCEVTEAGINKQIAACKQMDRVNDIIRMHQQQLQKLDELVKARFVEMFGDPELNPRGLPVLPWNAVFLTTTGKLDSNAMVENGRYPFFTCAKGSYKIDSYAFDCEALLLAGNNAAGIYDVKHYKGKFNAYQRTYVLRLMNEKWSYILFKRQLEDKLQYLQSQSKGTNTRYLTLGILNELRFVVPPVAEQEQFAVFVEQTDKSKVAVQKALDEAQLLFDSLMQKYFG